LEAFASVASHDLQEPLRKIVTFGERLDMAIGSTLEGDARTYLERMPSSAERMRKLINDLLAYSKITTHVQTFAPTDRGRIAGEVVADLEATIADAGARIELDVRPAIDADSLQMRQLLQNLVSNALKYRRRDVASVVSINSQTGDGRSCTLVVSDNGIGFDQRYSEKIFAMFERLHGRGQYEGSGIGPAIWRKIVDRHGGSIIATSSSGEGATFTSQSPSPSSRKQQGSRHDRHSQKPHHDPHLRR
jgi:light-regulated signal transduction histidine kinase (bacteriophytochrome)